MYATVRETSFGENELMTLGDLKGGSLQKATEEDFTDLASGAFLPRLQLMTANADKCKAAEFPINHYALVRDQKYDDLGPNVDVLVCSWRPMALTWGEDTFAVYDHKSDAFLEIQEKANDKVDGNMWGYQVLTWVPAANSFATFFAGSPTARRMFGDIKALMDKPATMGSHKITGKGKNPNVWFGPTCDECSTEFVMPDKGSYTRQMEKFNTPSENVPELAEEEDDARAQ